MHVLEIANRDIENWLKSVIAPMESQVREHQLQLRRRLESIKRIYKATDTLEDRILELELIEKGLQEQLSVLQGLRMKVKQALDLDDLKVQQITQKEPQPIKHEKIKIYTHPVMRFY